jgi:two-component system chemotaxis sensor kinase CheA
MSNDDEVVKEFLVESYEGLDRLDRDLVALEKAPSSKEIVASIFRTIHTIKGTSGFFGFSRLQAITHAAENLLAKVREGELTVSTDIANVLLKTSDVVRAVLASIEAGEGEGEGDDSALIERLSDLMKGRAAAPPPPTTVEPEAPEAPPAQQEGHRSASADSSIRVDVGLLDKLMTLAGELVLARNQILEYAATERDASLTSTCQRLNLITTEIQESVMKTRMQPIGSVWSKFPRVVRDLAVQCGKQVRIEMEGKDTDLDRTILEAIKDPLTHIVRNSVDHGIEAAPVRAQRGKPAEGCIRMRAYHEGGQVNIEIADDGGGLDPERIRTKAIERGLISAEQAARLGPRELANLIFLPGFSTAAAVTNVSGRGVGMDVVKTNIEQIGGTVDVQSELGVGTTVKIKIPLTLAIIPALIVGSAGDRYAIPQVSLLELVSVPAWQVARAIEHIHGAPVYRLRGRLLPLVHLNRELAVGDGIRAGEPVRIVVLQADGRQFGLLVDEIHDSEEIVVKPLGKQLKGLSMFAGATILGDGRVSLILDIRGLAQRAHVLARANEKAKANEHAQAREQAAERQALLLFALGSDGRLAMPLSAVARLEEIRRSSIERCGAQEVVQYRDHIMPLVRLAQLLGHGSDEDGEVLQVVVYTCEGRSVGLVVDRILDIVEQTVSLESRGDRPGILGQAVIANRVTELLDIAGVIAASGAIAAAA